MAFRLAVRRTIAFSPVFVQKSAVVGDLSVICRYRWGSSSSSSSSSFPSSPKSSKKVPDDRLASVIDAVNDRKLPPELRGQRNNVRSETDIINVVEHRVYHAMEEGQFENLPGKGKPLDLNTNPHADSAEDTLYRVLNKNGCAPEWVELNKEIRNSIAGWRLALRKAWTYKDGVDDDDSKWLNSSEALKLQLRDLNNKMFGFKWEREIDRLQEEIQAEK
ncbi:hypothetical protein ACS0TY_016493 [Phlomoides rotata]